MDPKDLLGATGIKICDLGVLILLEFWLLWHYRKDFYGKICLTSLWVKTSKTQKPFISYRPYSGDLLILMPRIRILHFPSPELAGLSKKSKRKLNSLCSDSRHYIIATHWYLEANGPLFQYFCLLPNIYRQTDLKIITSVYWLIFRSKWTHIFLFLLDISDLQINSTRKSKWKQEIFKSVLPFC